MNTTRHPYQLWIDLETTGLDERTDVPLEVGLVLTDEEFEVVDTVSWVIYENWFESGPFSQMPDFVAKMHADNGLIEECRLGGATISSIHNQMVNFVSGHGFTRADPLCGSSVGFDRRFCERYFPAFASTFSYRNVDVSSIKETVEKHRPDIALKRDQMLTPLKMHRVVPDIADTVAEYFFYLKEFGLV